ncbi:MAG: CvpA family protein [Clostridia bacterium]|nr:CvpA family protein [Clostridia bacterium]
MNIVDLLILGVIGVGVLFGLYKGFVNSVFGLFGVFFALIIAYTAYPQLVKSLQDNESLIRNLIHYSDASSRIQDLELSQTPVAGISGQALGEIMNRANLPQPFDDFVRANILDQVFAPLGSLYVSDYLNQTLVAVTLNILCFLVCFGLAYAAVMLLVHLLGYVFRMPVLKHFDLLLGGLFGGVRGVLLVFVFFAIVPVLLTVSPIEQVSVAIDESRLASTFYQTNLIQSIMQGTLF